MRLTELDPRFVGAGGEGVFIVNPETGEQMPVPERAGIGLTFNCPCGCGVRGFVAFENPLDGGAPLPGEYHRWHRDGDSFDTLTLRPSILRNRAKGGCGWHGFITDGEVSGEVQ